MRADILIVPTAEAYGTPELRIQRIADFRRRLSRFGKIVDMRVVARNLTDFAGRRGGTPDAFGREVNLC